MRTRTLATVIGALMLSALLLSACGGASASFSSGYTSAAPTTFVVLEFGGGPDTLDPALAYDSASGEILQNVYDFLVYYNRESVTELVPMLATEVPSAENGGISADGLTYTFKIRSGVKFHSGNVLTPEDVAFSLQRGILSGGSISPQWLLAEPILGSTSYGDITDQLDPEGEKELIDNRDALKAEDPDDLVKVCELVKSKIVADNAAGTVTVKLAQPWGPFLVTLAGVLGRDPGASVGCRQRWLEWRLRHLAELLCSHFG